MKRLVICTVLLLVSSVVMADLEYLSLDEVERGMRGECLTEMGGGEQVRVPVEVIGVLKGVGPEAEMVLIRLDDPRFDEVGVVAGMSGSPVYVDGKLLGALAFGWSFASEPIAGVTPFARMLPLAAGEPQPAPTAQAGRPELLTLLSSGNGADDMGARLLSWLLPGEGRERTGMPLAVAGSAPVGGWLAEAWRRLGWLGAREVAGHAAGQLPPTADPGDVGPGSMVATVMVEGDAVLAAGGTVTAIDGRQVWAFGHPNLGLGSTSMPLARAQVLAVLPSLASSFKFFAVGERIGVIHQDRERGVWGELGRSADLVPVEVTVNDRTSSYEVVPDPLLLPLLLAYVTDASYRARGRQLGETTVRCVVELTLDEGSTVRLNETYASADASAMAAALVSAVSAYLVNSPHRSTSIGRATVQLETSETSRRARIEQVQPLARTVHRGESLDLVVSVRPHRGTAQPVRIQLPVPEWLPAGPVDLVVADGAAWTAYDHKMRPTAVRSFADELRALSEVRPSTQLVAVLERPDVGLTLPGGSVPVPPTIAVGLSSGGLSNTQTRYHVVSEQVTAVPWSLSGAFRIRLAVDDGEPMEEGL